MTDFAVVRAKVLAKIFAGLLLALLVLSPLIQIYFRLGVLATRDSISGWSYGLAQIAFGLVAAFVIFLLPQVVEISRLRWKWEQTLRYYKETETFNRDAAFSNLRIALEAYSTSNLPSSNLSKRTEQWIVEQQNRPSRQAMTIEDIDASIKLLSHELKILIESKEQWKLMVEKAAVAIHYAWQSVDMRCLLFAAYSSWRLRSMFRTLSILLFTLIIISMVFGALALAPDPFWYIRFTKFFTGRVLFRSEPNYPEMSLWTTACIYLANIFCLTLWFGLETRSVHIHNDDQFEERIP